MLDEILNPDNWRPFEVENQLDFTKKYNDRPKKGKPNFWVNSPEVLSPLVLYKYLRVRFGRPNGFINMLKNNTSDNLIHWHYSLEVSGAAIDIIGKNSGLEILIKTNEALKLKPKDWKKLIENLQNDFKNYGKQMGLTQEVLSIGHCLLIHLLESNIQIQEYLAKLIK